MTLRWNRRKVLLPLLWGIKGKDPAVCKNGSKWLSFPHVTVLASLFKAVTWQLFLLSPRLSPSFPCFLLGMTVSSDLIWIFETGEEFSGQRFLSYYIRADHVIVQGNVSKIMKWRVVGSKDCWSRQNGHQRTFRCFSWHLFPSLGFCLHTRKTS